MMKKILFYIFLLGVSTHSFSQENVKTIIGTWKAISIKENGVPVNLKDITKIKINSKKFFSWFSCNNTNRITRNSIGGTYTYDGKNYVERINYVGVNSTNMLHKVNKFNVIIKGDKLYLTGVTYTKMKLDEVWQRIE